MKGVYVAGKYSSTGGKVGYSGHAANLITTMVGLVPTI